MTLPSRLRQASVIMEEFAASTGLHPARPDPERYLWTDAFAVCTFCGLSETTGDVAYSRHAVLLVDQVHRTLGRHRHDDERTGWISGLSEAEGARHPTIGGLRIGKPLPERGRDEPCNERLEWDRDGQYFHYLTKWMHALNRVGMLTGDPNYLRWAVELARAAHTGFTAPAHGGALKRMYWKMSIDLSRPLVPSMGQHDPLDGWVTCRELLAAGAGHDPEQERWLEEASADYAALCRNSPLLSSDPLGIGSLMADAGRIVRLGEGGTGQAGILERVLLSACRGMEIVLRQGTLGLPAESRLGFRELGLSIGLSAIRNLAAAAGSNPLLRRDPVSRYIRTLTQYLPVQTTIEEFWLDHRERNVRTWTDHRWINEVMLATSLVSEGFLAIRAPGARRI